MIKQLPKPFLGRILTEAVEDDISEYMKEKAGISKNSLIALPENYIQKHSVPVKKGKIVDMAVDAFGDAFRSRYGHDVGEIPGIGDVVMFIPGQSYKVDIDERYHMLADEDVIAFFPQTKEEVIKDE